ncbi:MAG: histidinol dehydrogenase [Rikenellaceae bacterium]
MEIFNRPSKMELSELLQRGTARNSANVEKKVTEILSKIKEGGDRSLLKLIKEIDGATFAPSELLVTREEIDKAVGSVSLELKNAIDLAKKNISAFHNAQKRNEVRVVTQIGVECWQKALPIPRIGLYVPGGTAPLFSTVLMLALPAKIAGCKEVILCTPSNSKGEVASEVLFAAYSCGVDKIYKIGGAMAIAAMAYGTESVPKVDKIFGPGNSYVTTAKQLVSLFDVAIDMPAGPSEVMIAADVTADASFVASDLLSQAEHGVDSQVVLVTTSTTFASKVVKEIDIQLKSLPRRDIISKSLKSSPIIVVDSINEVVDIINAYSPEHLIVAMYKPMNIVERVESAGSVFIGNYTPESAGDYASGTNHTLPTNGWARSYSGVNLDSFTKKMTFQHITKEGLKTIGSSIELMASAEGLEAHKRAVSLRLK